MKKPSINFQIGKNGLTENLLNSLKDAFKYRENVKVSVLKSAGHEKQNVREMAEKINQFLGKRYKYRILGFAIFLKKLRK